jgi:hypothetical protein
MVSADSTQQKKTIVPVRWYDDGVILIKDSHPAYIGWEKFLQNQERIKDNRYIFDLGSSGAVRDGYALLSGRVQCGTCLRSMCTRYNVGKYASYVCTTEVYTYGLYACLSIAARHLDRVVTDALLEALNPAQVGITLQAMEEAADQPDADQQREREALKQARAEADKVRKIFESVTLENDLVGTEYQQKLQAKLVEVRRLESKLAKTNKVPSRRLPDKVRQSLLALSHDVRSFWESEHVTYEERKRVLRCLIEKVAVKRRADSPYSDVTINWMTGQKSKLTIISDARCTHPEAIELMRKLAPTHTIRQIVVQLNQAGFKPAKADRFTPGIVYDIFRVYGISIGCRAIPNSNAPRGDGRYPVRVVAEMLNVSRQTVVKLYKKGLLEGGSEKPRSPVWIKISPEQVTALKRPDRIKSIKSKRYRT